MHQTSSNVALVTFLRLSSEDPQWPAKNAERFSKDRLHQLDAADLWPERNILPASVVSPCSHSEARTAGFRAGVSIKLKFPDRVMIKRGRSSHAGLFCKFLSYASEKTVEQRIWNLQIPAGPKATWETVSFM